MRWRRSLIGGGAIAAALLGAGAIVFQDNLTRFFIKPREPFQTTTPPPAPEYETPEAWAVWPAAAASDAKADIFYVHSTTYYSRASWNASVEDETANAALNERAAPNEAGPFLELGPVYAPRYRQATLFAFFTHKFDGVAARRLAYRDVKRAFQVFLETADEKRPFILVGYGQGGLHVQGLLQDVLQEDEAIRNRLAVAYVIGQATPLSLFEERLRHTPPCDGPGDIRCVISYTDLEPQFDEEAERTRRRSMIWTRNGDLEPVLDSPLLCVNPLTWTRTDAYVGPEAHDGAASATGLSFGMTPPAVDRSIGSRCVDGVLEVDRPQQDFLRRPDWFGAKWKAQHFNLFYFDLAADARRRAANTAIRLEEEYRFLDPIENSVDLEESPINKVPTP